MSELSFTIQQTVQTYLTRERTAVFSIFLLFTLSFYFNSLHLLSQTLLKQRLYLGIQPIQGKARVQNYLSNLPDVFVGGHAGICCTVLLYFLGQGISN